MNEDGILFLSAVLEILFLFSTAFALIVLWVRFRTKRSSREKDGVASGPRRGGLTDERRKE
ncbi:hypothetical protein DK847_13190 [Aestuariivirga litoralis]|uniref:Transmembrane protein n=1 Tax=Aestuariivirga litoralis TaxID=2650924 RepID=A0A2W2BJ00_9HYPH|nr:hypothetical protein DK847_13190 [Aestuariivirga litoralis]